MRMILVDTSKLPQTRIVLHDAMCPEGFWVAHLGEDVFLSLNDTMAFTKFGDIFRAFQLRKEEGKSFQAVDGEVILRPHGGVAADPPFVTYLINQEEPWQQALKPGIIREEII